MILVGSSGSELMLVIIYFDDIYVDEYFICLIWVWYIVIHSNQVLIIKY
jgi:hypothetical protein